MFSLPVFWIQYGYYREKLHVSHFWDLKGLEAGNKSPLESFRFCVIVLCWPFLIFSTFNITIRENNNCCVLKFKINYCRRQGGLMVSALDSGLRGLGSRPSQVNVLCSWAVLHAVKICHFQLLQGSIITVIIVSSVFTLSLQLWTLLFVSQGHLCTKAWGYYIQLYSVIRWCHLMLIVANGFLRFLFLFLSNRS